MTAATEHPAYWLPVEHTMHRRNQHNNYHVGHKAYMVTLRIEEMVPLLGTLEESTDEECTAVCHLSALGEAMRQAWLTLPERFHNVAILDSPDEYVIMPEHFHGILYVTGYMEEHLGEVIRLFKSRVAMAYRHLLTEATDNNATLATNNANKGALVTNNANKGALATNNANKGALVTSNANKGALATNNANKGALATNNANKGALTTSYANSTPITAVGTAKEWLKAYRALSPADQAATRQWIEQQLTLLYSATRCGTQESNKAITAPPIRVTPSGKHNRVGFLFGTGYQDSLLLDDENLNGHRLYIRNNPHSRWMRTHNRAKLKANRNGIDTAVSITALEGYLRRECPARDVTADKLALVRSLLLYSATRCGTQGGTKAGSVTQAGGGTQKGGMIVCHTYGDRELLKRRLLPVVCHRKDAWLFEQQKARCLQEAAGGAVMVSAGISLKEREIMRAVMAAGYPVIKVEDNGFPDLYHPSQSRIDLCAVSKLLIVTPWQYHYRHKDEGVFVAYCKTMNCIAQALCRTKDDWWRRT